MKFVHIADIHFDSSFSNFVTDNILGEIRRLDQRKILKKVIEYIKENNIECLFIAGDLYEHSNIRQSTIEYINHLFEEIPNTKIFISPGNHDPYLKNSYYSDYHWNNNVKIFSNTIEKISLNNMNIYGFGFSDFYLEKSGIEKIQLDEKEKINILITHASLNTSDKESRLYHPISENKLKEIGFDYIALGHIHKPYYREKENQNIVYPGSTLSLGFDELGEHGMIVGEIEKNKCDIQFIKLDEKQFIEKEINISEIISQEELIEYLNHLEINNNEYLKIILNGERNFEININKILPLINYKNILKIKNNTKIKYQLEEILKENTIRSIFVKKILKKYEQQEITKQDMEMVLEIGLEAMQGN